MSHLNSNLDQKPTLIIGNKNYSSWSLRGWLALHAFGLKFTERKLELFSEEFVSTLADYKGNKKVPLMIDGDAVVWDSLAIAEYINDTYLEGKGWGKHKAIARTLACEMHSGFFGVRSEMPMNIRATRKITPSESCLNDIVRINHIFTDNRSKFKHEGDYLLGEFSLADCFYAPVIFRLITYAEHSGIELSEEAEQYCKNMHNHPSMVIWQTQALTEKSVIEADEVGEQV